MRRTKKTVDAEFIQFYMPFIKKQEQDYRVGKFTKDIPLRCESYNNYIDSLCKDGFITQNQARSYCIPAYLIR